MALCMQIFFVTWLIFSALCSMLKIFLCLNTFINTTDKSTHIKTARCWKSNFIWQSQYENCCLKCILWVCWSPFWWRHISAQTRVSGRRTGLNCCICSKVWFKVGRHKSSWNSHGTIFLAHSTLTSGGITSLIQQLTLTENEELSKTVKYLLQLCVSSANIFSYRRE